MSLIRQITVTWEPGMEPSFDEAGWAPWELSALFHQCADQIDTEIEEMAEARTEGEDE